jgi:hypothetical protein
VLLSGEVWAALDADLRRHTRKLGSFVVKGKAHAVELFECYASDCDSLRNAKDASRERFDAMLASYTSGELEHAVSLAGELRDACPEDGPASWWFLRLIHELRDDATDPDDAVSSSQGIVVLDAK